MRLIRKLAQLNSYYKYHRFIKDTKTPKNAQEKLWLKTLKVIQQSSYWSSQIGTRKNLEDFEISEYRTYESIFHSDLNNKLSSLTNEEILFWAESTGTTGRPKLFPITPSYKKQFQSTNLPIIYGMISRFPKFLTQPVIYFAYGQLSGKTSVGIDIGYISGYNYRNIPKLLRNAYAIPLEVMSNGALYEKWAPLYSLATDLSAMISIGPASIRWFAETLSQNFPHYLPLLETGKAPEKGLPPIRVSQKRLQLIKEVFKEPYFSFKRLWPSLEFIGCWKSSSCGLQVPDLEPYLQGQIPVIDVTYSATEGWINVPIFNEKNGGPIHPGAIIVEFIEKGQTIKKESLLKLWELEANKDYEIFITNLMGLVRYRLYDVVRCTGFFNHTPIIEFVRKTSNELVLGMIRIGEDQLVNSVSNIPDLQSIPFVFGSSSSGNQLVLYHTEKEKLSSAAIQNVEDRLKKANKYYEEQVVGGLFKPLTSQYIDRDHPIWTKRMNAQAKPKIVTHEILAESI